MKLKYNFEYVDLEEQIVAVPIGENAKSFHGVVKLNESAALIMKLLQDGMNEEAIVDYILKEYDISEDALRPAVHECIMKLHNEELLA